MLISWSYFRHHLVALTQQMLLKGKDKKNSSCHPAQGPLESKGKGLPAVEKVGEGEGETTSLVPRARRDDCYPKPAPQRRRASIQLSCWQREAAPGPGEREALPDGSPEPPPSAPPSAHAWLVLHADFHQTPPTVIPGRAMTPGRRQF